MSKTWWSKSDKTEDPDLVVKQWPVALQAHIYLFFYKMKTTNSCFGGIISKECESHSGQGNPQNALVLEKKYLQADF